MNIDIEDFQDDVNMDGEGCDKKQRASPYMHSTMKGAVSTRNETMGSGLTGQQSEESFNKSQAQSYL